VFVLHGRIQISIFVRSCIQIFVDFRHSAWSISSVGDLISASLVLSTPVKAYVVRIQYTRAASSMNSQHHPTTANDLSRKRRKTSCNKENADPNNKNFFEKTDDTDVHESTAHALVSLQQSRQPMPASIPLLPRNCSYLPYPPIMLPMRPMQPFLPSHGFVPSTSFLPPPPYRQSLITPYQYQHYQPARRNLEFDRFQPRHHLVSPTSIVPPPRG
jgi:hypothetical protein